jgi:D-glycero-alpha-D-manno-heptose-7-phosphate kinase
MPISESFPNRLGTAAMQGDESQVIRSKSPMRISFAGGGTDLPHWFEAHGGAVLSSTINRYAYVTLYPRQDNLVQINSYDLGYSVKYGIDEKPSYDGVLDLAKAAILRLNIKQGLDMDVRSDAPPGSGLGGSSAMTSAVIGALANYTRQNLSCYDLAELNWSIERVDLEIKGGKQDQYATTFGGFNHMEFLKDRVILNPLRIDRTILNDLEAHLLLCYTGRVRADLGLIDKQINYYHQGRQTTIEGMHRLMDLVFEMKEALLKGELDKLGLLLHEAYENKLRMNPDIHQGTRAVALYEAARQHGALGGKLLGAGGGGYLLLYCQSRKQHQIRTALEEMGGQFTDFGFEGLGLQTWRSKAK